MTQDQPVPADPLQTEARAGAADGRRVGAPGTQLGNTRPLDAEARASESPDRSPLPPAAQRALAEAEARRRAAAPETLPVELGGRDGPEPVRYGDWEKKGIAVDF